MKKNSWGFKSLFTSLILSRCSYQTLELTSHENSNFVGNLISPGILRYKMHSLLMFPKGAGPLGETHNIHTSEQRWVDGKKIVKWSLPSISLSYELNHSDSLYSKFLGRRPNLNYCWKLGYWAVFQGSVLQLILMWLANLLLEETNSLVLCHII